MVKVCDIKTPLSVHDDNYDVWRLSLIPTAESNAEVVWSKATAMLKNMAITDDVLPDKVFAQSFEMANILSSLKLNSRTLIAAIFYPFVDKKMISLQEIRDKCSSTIASQIAGVKTMDAIRSLQKDFSDKQDESQIDQLRRMLLAMVDDVRVVLIKLAERLYLLRVAVRSDPECQLHLAREVRDVYAPLANRLGIGQLKWEMEDLAFRILQRKEYLKIAKELDEKRVAREVYVRYVLEILGHALDKIHVKADLQGRAKHIFSIWKKMQRKQVGFDEIYDVRAVRVLVPEIQDCYSTLGAVHGLWKHIPKEFDDYIATPKENGYRSLHTAVIGPDGKTLEVQIRTFEMHQESELGVAAHWKYKEGSAAPTDGYEAKIAWLRQLLDWQDEVTDSSEIVSEFKSQVLEERIYVFTPQGKLIDLPMGATPLDFAYRVHTEVGHRCRGAKVNGNIISLAQALKTGQKVEILTSKTGGPSRDWLSEHNGYVKSTRAKNKIHQWFRLQDKDKNAAAGKALLDKEIQKHNLRNIDLNKIAKELNFNKEEELFAAIGVGDKGLHQVINIIRSHYETVPKVARHPLTPKKTKLKNRNASIDILVEGVGNLLTRIAGCCKPVPGDDISGFVSQGRGIMIHRADCHHLMSSLNKTPDKVLQVEWSDAVNDRYLIDLLIKAYDRQGLLADITALMSEEKISVTSLNINVNKQRLIVNVHVQIEVANVSIVTRIMAKLEQISSVVSVQRKS